MVQPTVLDQYSSEILHFLARSMVRSPNGNALRLVIGIDNHSTFGLGIQRYEFVIRGGLDEYDRLFTA